MLLQVLLVDDEPAALMIYKKMLHGSDMHVDTANSLDEATGCLNRNLYHVIVSDLRLSGSSALEGFQLLRFVKEKNPKTQVILLTAYGNPEIKSEATHLGAALYLEKPVLASELRAAICNLGGQ